MKEKSAHHNNETARKSEPANPEKEQNAQPQQTPAETAEETARQENFPDAEPVEKENTCGAELAKLKKELEEKEGSRLRLLAEMDNLRKRVAKDMEAQRYNVVQDTLSPFLQVFDHFTMAVTAAGVSDNHKSLLDGMSMIQKEFDKAFAELGVEKIDAVGKDFDPKLHEAMAEEPSETVPAGKVIRQWSMGYKNGEKLLKPAMVVVSSGAPDAKQ